MPPAGRTLDPFAGGGTTLAVAQQLGMNSIGIDLNESFCDVMVRRLGGGAPKLGPDKRGLVAAG